MFNLLKDFFSKIKSFFNLESLLKIETLLKLILRFDIKNINIFLFGSNEKSISFDKSKNYYLFDNIFVRVLSFFVGILISYNLIEILIIELFKYNNFLFNLFKPEFIDSIKYILFIATLFLLVFCMFYYIIIKKYTLYWLKICITLFLIITIYFIIISFLAPLAINNCI